MYCVVEFGFSRILGTPISYHIGDCPSLEQSVCIVIGCPGQQHWNAHLYCVRVYIIKRRNCNFRPNVFLSAFKFHGKGGSFSSLNTGVNSLQDHECGRYAARETTQFMEAPDDIIFNCYRIVFEITNLCQFPTGLPTHDVSLAQWLICLAYSWSTKYERLTPPNQIPQLTKLGVDTSIN